MWVLRMLHETEKAEKAGFLTLTYDPENLPVTLNKPDGILNKHDLTAFWKRLRKALRLLGRDQRIRYYACGEYGDEGNRPHMHAIVWGIDTEDEALVARCWGMGRSQVDFCEADSIRYVAGYVTKKLGFNNSPNRQGYPPPFQVSSGGIGLEWLKENWYQVLYEGSVIFRGKRNDLPRYYRQKLADMAPDGYIDGLCERLNEEKIIRDAALVATLVPHLGGLSWQELSPLERTEVYTAVRRNGLIFNAELKSRQDIKLAGAAAKMAARHKRRLKI